MVNLFKDNFWDDDFNGTTGYDTLIERLKDGKKFIDVFTDFLRTRSKIEEDYGRNLAKLAQTTVGHNETGTLNASWEAVKKETENVARVHCELAKKLNDLIEKALKFREQQKQGRLNIDEKMKKLQKEKKTAYENVFKNKKLYEQRCKESDQAKEVIERTNSQKEEEKMLFEIEPICNQLQSLLKGRNNDRLSPWKRDISECNTLKCLSFKLQKNLAKAKTLVENTDSTYQTSVKALEDYRKKWILEMEDACTHFQEFEKERIQYMRNEMWTYANLGTLQAIELSTRYEDCRSALETCDENADISQFINKKHTGTQRPATIVYENFYHQSFKPSTFTSPSNSLERNNPNSLGRIMNAHGRPPVVAMLPRKSVDMGGKINLDDDTPPMKPLRTPPATTLSGNYVTAIYPYSSQGSQELTLRVGDRIKVMRIEDDSWALGELNGRVGAFPREFVEGI